MKRWIHDSTDTTEYVKAAKSITFDQPYDLSLIQERLRYLNEIFSKDFVEDLYLVADVKKDESSGAEVNEDMLVLETDDPAQLAIGNKVIDAVGNDPDSDMGIRACVAISNANNTEMKIAPEGECLFLATSYAEYKKLTQPYSQENCEIYTFYKQLDSFAEDVLSDIAESSAYKAVEQYVQSKGWNMAPAKDKADCFRIYSTRKDTGILVYFDGSANNTSIDDSEFEPKVIFPLYNTAEIDVSLVDSVSSILDEYSGDSSDSGTSQRNSSWPTDPSVWDQKDEDGFLPDNIVQDYMSYSIENGLNEISVDMDISGQGRSFSVTFQDTSGEDRFDPFSIDYKKFESELIRLAKSSGSANNFKEKFKAYVDKLISSNY